MRSIFSRRYVHHTDRHTGGLFGKIPGHLSQSGTAGFRAPTIQANVTVWKHQSVNKTLLCGSKGFQHGSKRQEKEKQFRISPLSRRMRPRVRVKRENCYHYLGEAKKVRSRKKIFIRRNNQDGYFISPSCRIPLLPCIIKIDCAYNFPGRSTEKERGSEGPIVVPAHFKNPSMDAVKWQFQLVPGAFFLFFIIILEYATFFF